MIFYECVFDMLFPRVLKIICWKACKYSNTFTDICFPVRKKQIERLPRGLTWAQPAHINPEASAHLLQAMPLGT